MNEGRERDKKEINLGFKEGREQGRKRGRKERKKRD